MEPWILDAYLLVVIYIRVSTDSQNIAMQLAAAQEFLQRVPEDRRLLLIDDGVSALKVKMNDRPKLKELITLIEAGKVGTLVVYNRDRLARNFYEALKIVKLLQEKKVKVIFTASGARPFDESFLVEAIAAMFAQLEGETIVRRRADAQQRFPSRLLGYLKEKTEDNFVFYKHDERADLVRELFERVLTATTPEAFIAVLRDFKKKFHCGEIRLLKMLRTPFYAGLFDNNGQMNSLDHVDPVVSMTLYQDVQRHLDSFKMLTSSITAPDREPSLVQPRCGVCGGTMKYRRDRLTNDATYSCASGHKRNVQSAERIRQVIQDLLERRLHQLNIRTVMAECEAWLASYRPHISKKLVALSQQRRELAVRIVNNYGMAESQTLTNRLLAEQRACEGKIRKAIRHQEACQHIQAQVNEFVLLTSLYLANELSHAEQMRTLAKYMIKRMDVYPNGRVEVQINYSRFFEGGETSHVS